MNIKDVRAQYPEYNDMNDVDLARAMHGKFYSDMPFDEFAGKVGLTQPQESKPAMSWGDALKESAGNIPSSSVRLAGDLWKSITSPIETAKAIGNTALGYGQKAVGVDGEATKYADAMNAYFKDRYGTEEGFKQAVAQDPAGVMADISTVFTGVGGALKGGASVAAKAGAAGRALEAAQTAGKVASTVGAYTDPITLAGKAVAPVARGAGNLVTAGQPLAEKLYGSALKPSPTLSPAERTSILRTGLDERILPNQTGSDKLRGLMGMTGDQVDQLIAASANAPIDTNAVAASARQQIAGGVHANTVAPSAAKASAEAVVQDFLDTHGPSVTQNSPIATIYGTNGPVTIPSRPTVGSPVVSTADAQKIKQATYKAIADAYGELSGPDKEARKALARALKDEIAVNVPEVTDINARLGKIMELNPEIERAIGRTQNHNFLGLGAILGGGAVGGSAGLLGPGLMTAGALKVLSEPANVARAAFLVDALNKSGKRIGGLLNRLPDSLNRRSLTYPAYVDRMREEAN